MALIIRCLFRYPCSAGGKMSTYFKKIVLSQGTNFYEFDGNMENIRNFARGMSISNQE